MLERICRSCQAGNPLEAQQCQQCGQALEHALPAAPTQRMAQLSRQVKQLPLLHSRKARSIALGLAALAFEVGTSVLQQRKAAPPTEVTPATTRRQLVRQRIWEQFDANGQVRSRVVENLVIRDE